MDIASLIVALLEQAVQLGQSIYADVEADKAALAQRLQDAIAALKGEKTSAHADLDARWQLLQAEFAKLSTPAK